jgi:flagellar biogenesis protein FliO
VTSTRIRLSDPLPGRPMAHRATALTRVLDRVLAAAPVQLRRRPALAVAIGAGILAAVVTAIGGRLSTVPGATGSAAQPAGSTSALEALGGGLGGASGASAQLPGGATASIDVMDLIVKGVLVVILLFITLRVLRRYQTGGSPAGARIRVIESRTIAPKATLHLVAIGERRLVVGLTPGRLVTLAELGPDEIELDDATDTTPSTHRSVAFSDMPVAERTIRTALARVGLG